MKLLPVIFAASVLCFACQQAPAPTADTLPEEDTYAFDTAALIQEIKTAYKASIDAWNAGDMLEYMEFYEKSDSLRTVSGARASYGWQPAVESSLKNDPKGEYMGQAHTVSVDIDLLSEHSALIFDRWFFVLNEDTTSGASTAVLRRLKEGWRIVHSHISYGQL